MIQPSPRRQCANSAQSSRSLSRAGTVFMTLERRVYAGVCLALTSMVLLCGIACAPAVRVAPLPPQWCAASTSTPGRVTACASADSESVADDRAFAQITRQLSQEVAVRETMTSGEEAQREANGRRVTRSFASYSENVQAVALARLLGARVEQRAQVGSTYYALASLDLRQVTRRVSAATDDAIAFAASGDVVRALGSCREARQQARLLPVLFAEVDANVGRCQTLSEALYERLSVTVVTDTLLRIHYEGRPVARLRVQVRRAGAATTPTILGESDELGFVRRVRPFPMVSGGALHEEFDVVWDGLDDVLETPPYRIRA